MQKTFEAYQNHPAASSTLGISDERGVFVLFLPPPAPNQLTSPPGTPYAQLKATVVLKFAFEPTKQKYQCIAPDEHRVTLLGNQSAELATKRSGGWRCIPDQLSLVSQSVVFSKTFAVALVGETTLRVLDNADSKDRSVWLP